MAEGKTLMLMAALLVLLGFETGGVACNGARLKPIILIGLNHWFLRFPGPNNVNIRGGGGGGCGCGCSGASLALSRVRVTRMLKHEKQLQLKRQLKRCIVKEVRVSFL